MKLKFKKQGYQTNAVEAVADCFAGQPKREGLNYRIDPGRAVDAGGQFVTPLESAGFKNADLAQTPGQVLENIHAVQRRQNLPLSAALLKTQVCDINLDVEMETGTGKTYCYVKSMFELNARFGWSKFIVVVPSIAIREGVHKSLEITAEHFLDDYKKRARFFIYNSKALHNLESFSSDAGINVMVINVQAFNATGKDARRIYEELDDFQSRRPIDVISANRPIMFLDEPQKIEGGKTLDSLANFKPLAVLRYSATHKTTHNKIHRLDALDAYNQKLVKKIAVRGISVKGLTGTNAYLYLESIEVSKSAPVARVELETRQNNGIKRVVRRLSRNDNLFDLSGDLEQYRGFVVSDINAHTNAVTFTNGHELVAGEAAGDVSESALRRIQIREAVKAHFEKEQALFAKGVKVLSLFFIDAVSKYRSFTNESGDAVEQPGEYAQMFEEEYNQQLTEVLTLDDPTGDTYNLDIFTKPASKIDFSRSVKANQHIYDYGLTDSNVHVQQGHPPKHETCVPCVGKGFNPPWPTKVDPTTRHSCRLWALFHVKVERDFVKELDASAEVVVYVKLPRGFFIPTLVGNYNPDWAIAFKQGKVKHVYFVAETKGSMSSMDLRKIEESKIECARKFFAKITSDQVKYDVVDGYGKLMELVV